MAWLHYWLSEIGWFVLVSLFIAALVTLVLYLLQYALGTLQRQFEAPPLSDLQETDSLLAWVLSLKSWKSQWLRAWISALNAEANKSGDSPRLTFEDDGSKQPLELSVRQVMSVVKSAEEKVVSCNVVGQAMWFSITVAGTAPAAGSHRAYSVGVSPLHLQLELHMKEDGEDVQVTWSFINFPNVNLEIQPKPGQEVSENLFSSESSKSKNVSDVGMFPTSSSVKTKVKNSFSFPVISLSSLITLFTSVSSIAVQLTPSQSFCFRWRGGSPFSAKKVICLPAHSPGIHWISHNNVTEGVVSGPSKIARAEWLGHVGSTPTLRDAVQALLSSVRPSVMLSTKPTDVKEIQNAQSIGAVARGMSPPKPPRIHELRLQVKNISAMLPASRDTAGNGNPVCMAQLNEPVQKFITAAAKNPLTPSWEEVLSFELNAKSKELTLHIVEAGSVSESPFLAYATVPIDLFRKQPSGQQSFALVSGSGALPGSFTAEFSYIEPSDWRLRQVPTPLPARKVETDRTVMPCGTVVTTVTAVKSKPRANGRVLQGSDSPRATPTKVKVMERNFSMQAMAVHGPPVSKTLSSSDTELLVLNGADPVAEAAIRQLRESAKQTPKSPRKKSTIIISGVSKTALAQHDEASLMMNYAATMDGTAAPEACCAQEDSTSAEAKPSLAPSHTLPVLTSGEGLQDDWEGLAADQHGPFQEWDHGRMDQDYDEMSGSNQSVSEIGTLKKSKGGFLRKSARLFFRRRHQQKDPGMSQSHNDLVFLQQQQHPRAEEQRRKGATLTRLLNKKLLPRNRSKGKLAGASSEQCA
ncbi:C2 domain-containing protein 2-like [Rhinatrema bivittatum]|uniref:C2 domain-containing protein 2-like n=1 Tax=Rhinatrema bivittatum TaxID=194408 RepID=UPI00112BDE1F|nr:C2 domain-containing protein 2-like [Rhinatrema bivittatum]